QINVCLHYSGVFEDKLSGEAFALRLRLSDYSFLTYHIVKRKGCFAIKMIIGYSLPGHKLYPISFFYDFYEKEGIRICRRGGQKGFGYLALFNTTRQNKIWKNFFIRLYIVTLRGF
ncbi:hypothetical protein LJC54_06490, partial [Parabacteroides sp. OttesenSCG-928-J18]|nr:hypothetical protein [Parabacteroides sp. OttesenSCG-928-J18]